MTNSKHYLLRNIILIIFLFILSSLSIHAQTAEDYFIYGISKKELNELQGALQDLNKAIELNPQNVHAYTKRGVIKSNLEDKTGAIQDYNKAIEINPKFADAYYNRGILKHLLKNYSGAIQDFDKAIELNPTKDAYAEYYSRGNAKSWQKDYSGAIQDFNKAIELNPKFAAAYNSRGLDKIYLGKKDEGCLDLFKASELGFAGAYEAIKKYCN